MYRESAYRGILNKPLCALCTSSYALIWPHRLTARTQDSHSCNWSSILHGVTKTNQIPLRKQGIFIYKIIVEKIMQIYDSWRTAIAKCKNMGKRNNSECCFWCLYIGCRCCCYFISASAWPSSSCSSCHMNCCWTSVTLNDHWEQLFCF